MRVWTIHLESSINETQGNPVQKFCDKLIGECHVLLTRLRNWKYAFVNSKAYYLKNSRFAYFLHFPNRSWLRSFCLAWGLGGKKARM